MEIKIFGTVEEIAALVAALQERRKEDALFLALGGDALGKHFPEEDKPMEKSRYEENARKIIDLVDGMTDVQWARIQHLITRCFEEKKAKVTFEKPEHLDLLMKQNLII